MSVFSAVRDKFGDFTDSLSGVLDKGVDFYGGIKDRISAIKMIDDETVNENDNTSIKKANESSILNPSTKTLILGAALVVVGFIAFKK